MSRAADEIERITAEQSADELRTRPSLQTTPGPWKWHTSNSWKRLRCADAEASYSVLEPYVCPDGHPDCIVSPGDMQLIESAPDLLAERDRLRLELDDAAKFIRVIGEELVIAGCEGGDRTVTLANLRKMRAENEALVAALNLMLYGTDCELDSDCDSCHEICERCQELEEYYRDDHG